MVGTDTYTPERMYFIPEHANSSRQWLGALPKQLAENIGWRNAEQLILPVWKANRDKPDTLAPRSCVDSSVDGQSTVITGSEFTVRLTQPAVIRVSEPFAVRVAVCNRKTARIRSEWPADAYAGEMGMAAVAQRRESTGNAKTSNHHSVDQP